MISSTERKGVNTAKGDGVNDAILKELKPYIWNVEIRHLKKGASTVEDSIREIAHVVPTGDLIEIIQKALHAHSPLSAGDDGDSTPKASISGNAPICKPETLGDTHTSKGSDTKSLGDETCNCSVGVATEHHRETLSQRNKTEPTEDKEVRE